jgi:hypothetical protein
LRCIYFAFSTVTNGNAGDSEEEGIRHFMVKVIEPQFNLQSEEANVPNLSCNLLSVIKLSNDSNCFVVFYPNKCEFQDLGLGRTFGSATMQDGLYYFVDNLSSNNSVLDLACSVSSLLVRTQVMMWHFRLGHPSFLFKAPVSIFI